MLKREKINTVRLTEAENIKLEERAERAGISKSAYIREALKTIWEVIP